MPSPQDLWIAQAATKQTGLAAEQIRDALRRHTQGGRAGETRSFADALVALGLVQPAIQPVLVRTATEMRLAAEEEALSRRLLELGLVMDRVVRQAGRALRGRELAYREGHNLVGELIGAGALEPSPGLSELVNEVRVAVEAGVRDAVMRGLGVDAGASAGAGGVPAAPARPVDPRERFLEIALERAAISGGKYGAIRALAKSVAQMGRTPDLPWLAVSTGALLPQDCRELLSSLGIKREQPLPRRSVRIGRYPQSVDMCAARLGAEHLLITANDVERALGVVAGDTKTGTTTPVLDLLVHAAVLRPDVRATLLLLALPLTGGVRPPGPAVRRRDLRQIGEAIRRYQVHPWVCQEILTLQVQLIEQRNAYVPIGPLFHARGLVTQVQAGELQALASDALAPDSTLGLDTPTPSGAGCGA